MKILIGKVVSTKTEKTAVVAVETKKAHPIYKKRVKQTKKYQAHDELKVKEGDWVKLAEVRPISKMKKWKIIEIIKK